MAEVLDITDLRDFDKTLGTIPRPRDLAEWDNRIRELQKEKALLKAQLTWKESKLSVVDRKTDEALHLLSQFQTYIGQPGELITKARIFDETVAKVLSMTRAKVMNIVVDYSSKMETLLVEMPKLMASLHLAALQPRTLDLSKFPKIPTAEILHGLSTPTKATGTMTSSPSFLAGPGSDAQKRPIGEQSPATKPTKSRHPDSGSFNSESAPPIRVSSIESASAPISPY